MSNRTSEYDKFESLAGKLMKVPHREVQTKLNAEKRTKERKKAKKFSASRERA